MLPTWQSHQLCPREKQVYFEAETLALPVLSPKHALAGFKVFTICILLGDHTLMTWN